MKIRTLPTLLAATLLATPAMAVYKCKSASGSTTYQATPCENGSGGQIDARPAAGYSPASTPENLEAKTGASADAASGNSYQKKEGPFGESWRRMTYLQNRGVPDARAALNAHQYECQQKMDSLQAQKSRAANNLAGATWEQSISAQMQAEATMCASRSTLLQQQKDQLEQELRDLEAKKP